MGKLRQNIKTLKNLHTYGPRPHIFDVFLIFKSFVLTLADGLCCALFA
jgi:hypothetical protein